VQRIGTSRSSSSVDRIVDDCSGTTTSSSSGYGVDTSSGNTTSAKDGGNDNSNNGGSSETGSNGDWNDNSVTARNNIGLASSKSAISKRARVGVVWAYDRNENTSQDRIAHVNGAKISICAVAANVEVNTSLDWITAVNCAVVLVIAKAGVQVKKIVSVATIGRFASNFGTFVSDESLCGAVNVGP